MYMTTIKEVNGLSAVDVSGKMLRIAGNDTVAPGKSVWTDGKIIYGHHRTGGGFSYVPKSGYLWLNSDGLWRITRTYETEKLLNIDWKALEKSDNCIKGIVSCDNYAYLIIGDKYGYSKAVYDLMTGQQIQGELEWQREYTIDYEDYCINSETHDLWQVIRYHDFASYNYYGSYHYVIYKNGKQVDDVKYGGEKEIWMPKDRPYINENGMLWCEMKCIKSLSDIYEDYYFSGSETTWENTVDGVHYKAGTLSTSKTWSHKFVYHAKTECFCSIYVEFPKVARSVKARYDEDVGAIGRNLYDISERCEPRLIEKYKHEVEKYVWYEIVGDIRDCKNGAGVVETHSGWGGKHVTHRSMMGEYECEMEYCVSVNWQRGTYSQILGPLYEGPRFDFRDVHYYLYYVPYKFNAGKSWKDGALNHQLDLGNHKVEIKVPDNSSGNMYNETATVPDIPELGIDWDYTNNQIMSIYDIKDGEEKIVGNIINKVSYENDFGQAQWQFVVIDRQKNDEEAVEAKVVMEAEARYNFHCGWFDSLTPVSSTLQSILFQLITKEGDS